MAKRPPDGFERLGKNRRELECSPWTFVGKLLVLSCWLLPLALLVVVVIGIHRAPVETLIVFGGPIVIVVGGTFVAQVFGKSGRCLGCHNKRLRLVCLGHWTGEDENGRTCGGDYSYSVCEQCGTRHAHWDREPYIPTDEEWNRYTGSSEKGTKDQGAWPFSAEEDLTS